MTVWTRERVNAMLDALEREHPQAVCELVYDTPFQLLVAVILSAQCTDKRVNQVTAELFRYADKPEQYAVMAQEDLESRIYSCGFYRNKAKNIIAASRDIVERFDSQVPRDIETLMTLAGVGRKTANVVYAVAFGGQAIAVDTHVLRLSNRIGLAQGDQPLQVEKQLMQVLPRERWTQAHHLLIHHGRYTCSARSPKCDACSIRPYCMQYRKWVPAQTGK